MNELRRTLVEEVFYPAHDPRTASSLYRRVHHHLVSELDLPCWICGITNSAVQQLPAGAPRRARQIETHHCELEWAAVNGVDLARFTKDWPSIDSRDELREWVDSEGNMLVLCALHHRGPRTGIHSISYPAWKLQRWQGDEFVFIEQGA